MTYLCLWKCGFGYFRGKNGCVFLSNAEVWEEEDALGWQGGNLILGQICGIRISFYCVCFAS